MLKDLQNGTTAASEDIPLPLLPIKWPAEPESGGIEICYEDELPAPSRPKSLLEFLLVSHFILSYFFFSNNMNMKESEVSDYEEFSILGDDNSDDETFL